MKQTIIIVARWYLFWMILFALSRLFFLLYNAHVFDPLNLIVAGQVLYHALLLDASAAAYLTALPALILIVFQFWPARFLQKMANGYFVTVVAVVVTILISNTVLYKYWQQIIGFRAIQFLSDPNEVMASVTFGQTILYLCFFCVAVVLALFLFFKLNKPLAVVKSLWYRYVIPFVLGFITFYFIRGGFQVIPINESAAFFSDNTVYNHAAINPPWYFMRNIQLAQRAGNNPLKFFENDSNDMQYATLMHIKTDSTKIISQTKPNVLFIILESHTSDVVFGLQGDAGNSPCLDALIKNEALTFTNCYASGFRTDQMLPSLFSGFPAQNNNSIMRHSDKVEMLPHLPKMFSMLQYHTSFLYAGEMNFANMKSYLVQSGFKTLIDKNQFGKEQLNSKWGAHDGYAFDKLFEEINRQQKPFFTAMLTLSLHEPFDLPVNYKFGSADENQKFKSAAYYTDSCLGNFITASKKQAWYANTLIVIVADHGHRLPRNRSYYDAYTHRIPLLFTGGALDSALLGKKISHTVSQHDVPAFICSQFNLDNKLFKFSKDMLQNQSNFAYLCYDDGLAWVTDSVQFHYNLAQQKVDYQTKPISNKILMEAKTYSQKVYTQFLEYGH